MREEQKPTLYYVMRNGRWNGVVETNFGSAQLRWAIIAMQRNEKIETYKISPKLPQALKVMQ